MEEERNRLFIRAFLEEDLNLSILISPAINNCETIGREKKKFSVCLKISPNNLPSSLYFDPFERGFEQRERVGGKRRESKKPRSLSLHPCPRRVVGVALFSVQKPRGYSPRPSPPARPRCLHQDEEILAAYQSANWNRF